MSEPFAVFLLMNNYFHDVATAMLLACGLVMWTVRKAGDTGMDRTASSYASAVLRSVSRLAWFSVAWIVVSGIVRIATIKSFEWENFVQKHIEAGLIAKYIIAVVMMAVGASVLMKQAGRIKKTTTPR